MPSGSPAVQKALAKLEASLDAGQSYEGHELFKTVFYRLRSRRKAADSYALAEGGAELQLRKGQLNCGTELACMLLDAYTTDSTTATEELVGRVLRVLSAFPSEQTKENDKKEEEEPPIDQCLKVASAANKWLKKVSGLAYAPQINENLASYITKCLGWMGLGLAMPHYARSNDFFSFASAVAAAVREGHPGEEDLFIARAALHIASALPYPSFPGTPATTSLERAREFLSTYPTAAGHAVPSTPLIHFLDLYLEALEKKSSPLVDVLLNKYKITLDRDPSLWDLIGRSRGIYAPVVQMQGMFGDLFRSMMMPGVGSEKQDRNGTTTQIYIKRFVLCATLLAAVATAQVTVTDSEGNTSDVGANIVIGGAGGDIEAIKAPTPAIASAGGNVTEIKSKKAWDKQQAAASKAGKKIVVNFSDESFCGPCKKISPEFEKLSTEFTDLVFLKVNSSKVKDVTEKIAKVVSIPTFQVWEDSKKVDQLTSGTKDKLKSLIEKAAGGVESEKAEAASSEEDAFAASEAEAASTAGDAVAAAQENAKDAAAQAQETAKDAVENATGKSSAVAASGFGAIAVATIFALAF